MSRTAHHVRYEHWNIRRPDYYWAPRWRLEAGVEFYPHRKSGGGGWVLARHEEILGNVVYDLRYYAGCKRVPRKIVRRTPDWGGWPYAWGHGGMAGVKHWADQIEGGIRAAARDYARAAVKTHRAGGDVEELLEPDGRTRGSALYEAW